MTEHSVHLSHIFKSFFTFSKITKVIYIDISNTFFFLYKFLLIVLIAFFLM